MKNIIFPVHILAAAALIRDGKGRILLLLNKRRGWEFPGGQVENGENLIEAVKREVKEETGIDTEIDRFVGLYSNTGGYDSYDGSHYIPTKLLVDFTGHADGNQPIKASEEHEDIAWVSEENALRMVTHPHYQIRLKNMLKQDGNVVIQAYSRTQAEQDNQQFVVSLDERLPV